MKPFILSILVILLLFVVTSTIGQVAAQNVASLPPDWSPTITETDSTDRASLSQLIIRLFDHNKVVRRNLEVGSLQLRSYTYGTSSCQQQGLAGRFFPHLLPFQCSPGSQTAYQAISNVAYQWPGEMHMNTLMLNSNNRRKGQKVVNELYQAMLPIYSTSRYDDEGSKKSFVLPFYDVGPLLYSYRYAQVDTAIVDRMEEKGIFHNLSHLCCIEFTPIRKHHTLLQGRALVDSVRMNVVWLECEGRIDMATFHSQISFSPDALFHGQHVPYDSDLDIHYRYWRTRATNSYHTVFKFFDYVPLDSIDRKSLRLDLTDFYTKEPEIADGMSMLKRAPLPAEIDSIINYKPPRTHLDSNRVRNPHLEQLEDWGETLVDGTRLGPEGNRLRIYGPLDPATLGYDKLNGFTIREQARYNGRFQNGQTLYLRGEMGYAFGLKEFRWRLFSEYTYLPRRRGRFTLEARRNTSTFSSRFIQTINEALKAERSTVNFDSLGIEYLQRYDLDIQHSIELTNGLMLHVGIDYTYRRPAQKLPDWMDDMKTNIKIEQQYSDFAPYILLEYTPRQYYWYDRGYKRYITSPAPTFSFEFSRAIPGAFGTKSNFGRTEFDVQQRVRLSRTSSMAYHFSAGKFFNRRGEYFINYRYFARSQYPEMWEDDRIGGTFHLLNDYWYSSSPSYVQSHFMYETPFGLINHLPFLSRYIINERLYVGTLWAEGKSLYHELGYGIANNYFNVGFFVGVKDAAYYGCGVKFRLEIGSHI